MAWTATTRHTTDLQLVHSVKQHADIHNRFNWLFSGTFNWKFIATDAKKITSGLNSLPTKDYNVFNIKSSPIKWTCLFCTTKLALIFSLHFYVCAKWCWFCSHLYRHEFSFVKYSVAFFPYLHYTFHRLLCFSHSNQLDYIMLATKLRKFSYLWVFCIQQRFYWQWLLHPLL